MSSKRPDLRPPSLHDQREGQHLLVWGEVAQWMVVDEELYQLLLLLDGRSTVSQLIERHARRWGKPREVVEPEIRSVLAELSRKSVVRGPGGSIRPETVRLTNITLNLTNRCNLRCAFCYNAGRQTEEVEVARLMDGVQSAGSILDPAASLIVLGGEPFLQRARLLEAIDRAGSIFRTPVLVSTNGTLLDDETVASLSGRRVEVQVSLDSPRPERHDAIRGAGSYGRTLDGLRRLVRAGVRTVVNLVFTRESVLELEPYLRLAQELGVDEARFIPLRQMGAARQQAELAPDYFRVLSEVLAILERQPALGSLLGRDYFSVLMTVCRYSTPRTGCGIGRRVVLVDADGTVYPCPNHVGASYVCGRIGEKRLEDIVLRSSVMERARSLYQVARYRQCRDCAYRYWCAGDCRGETLAATGDPHAPAPHCEEIRRCLTEMIWLVARGQSSLGARPVLADGKRAVDVFLD